MLAVANIAAAHQKCFFLFVCFFVVEDGRSHVNSGKCNVPDSADSTQPPSIAGMDGAVGLEPTENRGAQKNVTHCQSGSSLETTPAFTGSLPLCPVGWGGDGGVFLLGWCLRWGGKRSSFTLPLVLSLTSSPPARLLARLARVQGERGSKKERGTEHKNANPVWKGR